MEFNKMYQKVKYIVRKCEKEYYIQLWEKDDWEQEGQLTLFELYQKNPEIETNEELLYTYFKTKFRNHIKDKIRQQESDKRKINRLPYIEIGEISHRISSRKIYLDELVVLRDALKRFKEKLTVKEKEQYEALLTNRRCLGKTKMKKKLVVALISAAMVTSMLGACGSSNASSSSASSTATSSVSASSASEEDTTAASSSVSASSASEEVSADADQEAADKVAALIDAIYVQERNDNTDEQCKEAKEAWDALTDAQKELVEGENADPDYFGRDTGDASKDDPLNGDEIGENELLVVSFGTSFNDSRAEDIGGVEKALQAAYPDWSVRRAFTAQIIINHVQARDDEKIDNVDQALERAVSNGVKKLIIQPTHLMHGAEYDELKEAVDSYKDKFESVTIAEPLLGEVGSDATVINEDKQAVAEAITAQAVKSANYDSLDAAAEDGTAFVFMGHGTSHNAKVTYSQMQTQMDTLGYKNVFIGTVEGEPEETACENVIEAVKAAGYKKVILRPLMVVAGDHANNDMAGEDEDSWKSQFEASGAFDEINTQIEGLGRIDAVEQLYVQHTKAAMDGNGVQDDAE